MDEKEQAQEAARRLAIQRWVEKHGSDNQKARMREGLLPEREILEAVRDQLFEPLDDGYTSAERLTQQEVCGCACWEAAEVKADPAKELNADQYDTFTELRDEAPKSAKVTPILWAGTCGECDCRDVKRLVVRVEILWHGFIMKREYTL